MTVLFASRPVVGRLKIWIGALLVPIVSVLPDTVFAQADWVHFDGNSTLVYSNDNLGNHLIDYSYAGYQGGGVAIPTNLTVQQTVSPVGGDNTANIQNALNTVGSVTPDPNGFRGAVLLSPGTYEMDGALTFNNNGVVLRGSGTNNTTLVFYGTSGTSLTLSGGGVGHISGATTHYITDSYVPLGATSFHLDSTSELGVGTNIVVERPFMPAWITAIGMSNLWGTNLIYFTDAERTITAINSNQVTVDIPLPTPIESQWTTGDVWRHTDGRLQQCGVENLSLASNFGLTNTASNGGILAISLGNAENCWVRNIAFNGYGGAVSCGGKWNTVQDCTFANGPNNGSARPGAFEFYNAQLSLVQRVTGVNGFEHFLQTRDEGAGPLVFLNCNTTGTNFDVTPHRLWATGLLIDNASGTIGNAYIQITTGGGNGWGAGFSVFYNCSTASHSVQCPAVTNHYNWWIGGAGMNLNPGSNPGTYDHDGTMVSPQSLYLEQLKERLGGAAVENIGYPLFSLSGSPASQTIIPGTNTTFTVNVGDPTLMSNRVALSFSGLPAGASATLNTNSVTGAGNAILTVTASNSIAPGNYPLNLIGTSAGLSHTSSVSLVIGSFMLLASPPSRAIPAGSSTNFTVSVVTNNNFTGNVDFSVSGLPANASAGFLPPSVGGSASSTLTVAVPADTPAGSYPLTMSGSGAGLTNTVTVTLTVSPPVGDIWTGDGAPNGNWSLGANWGGTAPLANDLLFFAGTVQTVATNDFTAGTAFNGLTFTGDAGAFILNGNGIVLDDDLSNDSTNTQAINLALTLNTNVVVDGGSAEIILGGAITGSGALTNAGSGTLVLTNNTGSGTGGNTFSGGVTVNAGTVSVSQGNSFLADGRTFLGSGNVTVNPGGTLLAFSGDGFGFTGGLSPSTLFINGGTVTKGTGTGCSLAANLIFTGGTLTTAPGDTHGWTLLGFQNGGTGITVTTVAGNATATISAGGSGGFSSTKQPVTFNIASGSAPGGVDLLVSAVLRGTKAITKTGAGVLELSGANTMTGGITNNGGVIIVAAAETPGTSGPLGKSGTVVFGGGTLQYSPVDTADYSSRFNPGPNQACRIDVPSGLTVVFASALASSGGNLTKLDGGTLNLSAASTYTGNTTVNGGTLALSGSGSLASTNITVAGGAEFDVSGLSSFALGATQTLSNSSSTAWLSGNISSGSATVSLNYTAGTPSFTITNGTLTLAPGGTFNLNNLGPVLAAGGYKIISKTTAGNAGSIAGTAPSSVTVTGGGIAPGTVPSLRISGGELYLVVAQPRITGFSLNGTMLTITATNGSPGGNWALLQTTNLALPINQWPTNRTGLFDANGNLSTNLVNTATQAQTFYRLKQ